ncbi:caspase-12 [Octodon degus]|uniref:Caspase-12 n=1 Tax=Octodon degus TaxID=10160 RepID=A0A6P3EV09_OCTDE|nr:caspase-12 [Octodon degus]
MPHNSDFIGSLGVTFLEQTEELHSEAGEGRAHRNLVSDEIQAHGGPTLTFCFVSCRSPGQPGGVPLLVSETEEEGRERELPHGTVAGDWGQKEYRALGHIGNFVNQKNCITKKKMHKIKKKVKHAEYKTRKFIADHHSHSRRWRRSHSLPEKDEESEQCASAATLTASKGESKENSDEEIAVSVEELAISPTGLCEIHGVQPEKRLKLCPYSHFQQLKTAEANKIYPIMEKEGRTRLALIICNTKFDYLSNRDGAEVDLLRMQDLLNDLGYSVVVKENLTAQEMETELREFAHLEEHRSSDSTFLVFMSHGILDGICGTRHSDRERDVLCDDTVFAIFNNNNCRHLINKPKIIITQACRGDGDGVAWVTAERRKARADIRAHPSLYYPHSARSDAVMMTHVEKDFIAFKSSTPHNVSWLTDTAGSLFISQLTYFLKEYCWRYHLEDVFRKVQRSFETPTILTQMPTIERVSMTRYFYLFPGI